MSMELLKLRLQFFAEGEDEEEETPVTGTEDTPITYTMPENTVAAPVAQDFDTWYKANGGMDEAGYYAKYGLDPDRDYQNTVNTLNYEYQTSMANYGEQAEKMYQMGLQNSGVSDIFRANAFSSYLGNMNQAAADRITARKKNKAAFNDYVAGMRAQHGKYETGIKTDYDTKLNSALTYAMSKYNGYNLQDVLNALGVSGYYTEIVDEVGKRLSGMDATSLQATTETVLAQDIINNISGFTGSDNDLAAAISMYGGMYSEDVIRKAFERAKTIYQNSAAGQDATLNSYIDQYYGSYDGTNIDSIDLGGIEDADMQTKVKEGIKQRFTNTVAEIYNMIKANYTPENANALRLDIENTYPGKYTAAEINAAFTQAANLYENTATGQDATLNSFIDQYYGNYTGDINTLDLSGIEDEGMREKVKEGINQRFTNTVAEIYNMIKANYTPENADALRLDIENTYPGKYTAAEINAAFTQAANLYEKTETGTQAVIEDAVNTGIEDTDTRFNELGSDYTWENINSAVTDIDSIEATYGVTDASKTARNGYYSKGAELVLSFMNGDKNISDAKNYLKGFLSADIINQWDSLDDDGKRKAIVEAAVSAGNKIDKNVKNQIIDEYVNWKMDNIIEIDMNTDGEAALADAGGVLKYVNNLGLDGDDQRAVANTIIDKLGLSVTGTEISWANRSEATVSGKKLSRVSEELNNVLPKVSENDGDTLTAYGGKLYIHKNGMWQEISKDNLRIKWDWHTNTDEEREGIYDLLVVLLEPNVDNKSDGKHGGGHSKDTYAAIN